MNFIPKIRILPVLIFIAILFLGLRINHFVALISGKLEETVFIEKAIAQSEDPTKKTGDPAAASPSTPADANAATATDASQVNPDLLKQNTKVEGEGAEKAAEPAAITEKNISKDVPANYTEESIRPQQYQPEPNDIAIQDKEVLLTLVERRKNLEDKKRELEEREVLLQITEKRIDEKFKELQSLKLQLEGLLGELDKEQEAQILSLVKVYETMKPVDAARIFDGLELNILIEVADKMKEAKFAPVLAKMDSDKAKYLTKLLAEKRHFSENKKP